MPCTYTPAMPSMPTDITISAISTSTSEKPAWRVSKRRVRGFISSSVSARTVHAEGADGRADRLHRLDDRGAADRRDDDTARGRAAARRQRVAAVVADHGDEGVAFRAEARRGEGELAAAAVDVNGLVRGGEGLENGLVAAGAALAVAVAVQEHDPAVGEARAVALGIRGGRVGAGANRHAFLGARRFRACQ